MTTPFVDTGLLNASSARMSPAGMLNVDPATWVNGVPVFPVTVPDDGISPGTKICNRANAPASSLMCEDVSLPYPNPFAVAVAVTIQPGFWLMVLSWIVAVSTPFIIDPVFKGTDTFGSSEKSWTRLARRRQLYQVVIVVDREHRDADVLSRREILNAV